VSCAKLVYGGDSACPPIGSDPRLAVDDPRTRFQRPVHDETGVASMPCSDDGNLDTARCRPGRLYRIISSSLQLLLIG
jgi:hypothetical protein